MEQKGLQLFPERLKISFNNKTISVTKNEADIIEVLLERFPRVAGREDLSRKIMG